MVSVYILILLISVFLLVKAGTWVVRALTRIARILEWSEFLVAFFFMAFASSLPEFFIGISAAFHKLPQLSFGNIIGANILNLTVGVAIAALLAGGLTLKNELVRKDAILAVFLGLLPLFLMLDGSVSQTDGIILLFALIFYIRRVFRQKERFTKILNDKFRADITNFKMFLKELGIFFGSIVLLLLASEGVVRAANLLALGMNISLVETGILFVSLGTVLPEIVFGVKAVSMGHKNMVLGAFVGPVVINSTFILGLVSLISPLKIHDFSPYIIGILFTVLVVGMFAVFSSTDRKISKKEAIVLILVYLIFVVLQFVL